MVQEMPLPAACPRREELSAFQVGRLPVADLERLADHLSICDPCSAALADLPEPGLLGRLRLSTRVPLVEEPECRRLEARAQAIDRGMRPAPPVRSPVTVPPPRPWLGGTLEKRLAGRQLGVAEATELVAGLAQAVQEIHAAGLVHGHLKPSNVLLLADGTPKVADFASPLPPPAEAVLAPAAYLAPEQAAGMGAEAAGPAADVFALGVILYECLTGRPPFQDPNPARTLQLVQRAQPKLPSRLRTGLPRDLEAICLKCLQKRPQARYPTAKELAEDLERWLCNEPTLARP